MKRRRKPLTAAEKKARLNFRINVLAMKGGCVMRRAYSPCDGPLDPHHLIPKQRLKAHALGLSEDERIELLWDPDNGVPVCRKHHELLTTAAERIRPSKVPHLAITFAGRHNLMWALWKECPGLVGNRVYDDPTIYDGEADDDGQGESGQGRALRA